MSDPRPRPGISWPELSLNTADFRSTALAGMEAKVGDELDIRERWVEGKRTGSRSRHQ